jgi:hypothetical protein
MLAVIKQNREDNTMMKLRIATGLGLVLFMATMIGGPVRVSHAQDDGGVTLADLAGKFAGRGGGFETLCFNAGFTALEDCATAPHVVPFNITQIFHSTRDAAGNICSINTVAAKPVFGTTAPTSANTSTVVGTTLSFDPTTGAGTVSQSVYHGGSCIGAVLDSTGATLVATATASQVVSNSGNRIETITTGYSAVTSAFSVAGSVKGLVLSATSIRQGRPDSD